MATPRKTRNQPASRSEAQREQARINGRRSRGPRTPEGKAISSENAVKHGFSGKKLVAKKDRPVLDRRIEVFSAEAGESPLLQGAAGFAAIAMTQAEAICQSRHLDAEAKCRRIRRKERGREADLLDDAEKVLAAGNYPEGYAQLARVPRGCMTISGQWLALADQAAALPADQPIGPVQWEQIDRLRSTIPPEDRSILNSMLDRRRQTDQGLLAGELHKMAEYFGADWEKTGVDLREDWDQDLEARLGNARADLGNLGQRRHRYFQSAQSNYRQMVALIHRGPRQDEPTALDAPERNEPENASEVLDKEQVAETDRADRDDPTNDVEEAPDAERNEPENASEVEDESDDAEIDVDNPPADLPFVLTPMMVDAIRDDHDGEPETVIAAVIRRVNAIMYRKGARPAKALDRPIEPVRPVPQAPAVPQRPATLPGQARGPSQPLADRANPDKTGGSDFAPPPTPPHPPEAPR